MKNEDKILELLAEYLKKTDQMIERIDKQQAQLEVISDVMVKNIDELIELRKTSDIHTEELIALRKETNKREIQQEVLLKEIFSISKRVNDVENKL